MISSFLTIPLWVRHCRLFILVVCIPLVFSSFACAKRSRSTQLNSIVVTAQSQLTLPIESSSARININTASAKELEALPGIGKGLAERVIEHRQRYGPFNRPEHLIMVRGISEHRFQAIRDQITVE